MAGAAGEDLGDRHHAEARWLLEMIFPRIGKRPIREVTAPELLAALRKIESPGHHETAHRAKQKCGQVFRNRE